MGFASIRALTSIFPIVTADITVGTGIVITSALRDAQAIIDSVSV